MVILLDLPICSRVSCGYYPVANTKSHHIGIKLAHILPAAVATYDTRYSVAAYYSTVEPGCSGMGVQSGEYTYLDPLCETIDRYYDIFSSTRRRRLQVDDSINTPYREGSLPLFCWQWVWRLKKLSRF